jgi:hypothetical protein
MFVLVDDYEFKFPVDVKMPDPKTPGRFVTQQFQATFRAMSQDEARRIDGEMAELSDAERQVREHELLHRVVLDWSDVVGEDRKPVAFSDDALAKALQFPWVRTALYTAYAKAMSGDAKRGN